MQIKNFMTRDVRFINENCSIFEAVEMMEKGDFGSLIVESEKKISGMLTDRDIALRAVRPDVKLDDTTVKDCMTRGIEFCYEDESIEEVGRHMSEGQFRRLPVLNRNKKLVGIVSIVDLAEAEASRSVAHQTLRRVSH